MAYSVKSKISDLLSNPDTLAFIEKNMPELPEHPMLAMIKSMPLEALAPFSEGKLTDEVLAKIDVELGKRVSTRSTVWLAMTLAMLGAASGPVAWADEDPRRDVQIEERFKAADKNGDGKLSLEEARAGMPRIARVFDKIDTEKRGYLAVEQIKKFVAARS